MKSQAFGTRTYARAAAALVLVIHTLLLAWSGYRHGFTWDEVAILPAGISHWKLGRFDLCQVNPPLVRMVAALPVLFANPQLDWRDYRAEFPDGPVGVRFLRINGERSLWLLVLARWACIPFSLLGALVCFRWGRELYGDSAAVLALALWCFSPNILGHAALITADVAAAAFGVLAFFLFWRWLQRPGWPQAIAAGVALGIVQLTKTSWIILFILWPAIWALWRWDALSAKSWRMRWNEAGLMALIVVLAWYVINVGYGFSGSLTKLGEYRFYSSLLTSGDERTRVGGTPGNRFAGESIGQIRVPLPSCYVSGVDRQKYFFELGQPSFLGGTWRTIGWWYYYLYGLAVKETLGTWVLMSLAFGAALWRTEYASGWRNEFVLIAPVAALLLLVSSQTGFNKHIRYVLPVLPFLYISISRIARAWEYKHSFLSLASIAALIWMVSSSLWVFPHSLSYFNELVGGPQNGYRHMASSNTDWGQDLLYLREWATRHPEARPFYLAWHVRSVDPKVFGLDFPLPPADPKPGWYALSVNCLNSASGTYRYFERREPIARVGYSVLIFHITDVDT